MRTAKDNSPKPRLPRTLPRQARGVRTVPSSAAGAPGAGSQHAMLHLTIVAQVGSETLKNGTEEPVGPQLPLQLTLPDPLCGPATKTLLRTPLHSQSLPSFLSP